MSPRLALSLAMLAAGATLLIAPVHASTAKHGGIFRVAAVGPGLTMDPQVSYYTTTWWLEYATAAKLFNYPDRRGVKGSLLVPEVAKRFKVSRNGRVYTFYLRKSFRFSDGTPVRARHFAYAIRRVRSRKLESPAGQFIPLVKSFKAEHNTLTIRLRKPDGTFLSKITMPFFQATSTKLPLDKEVSVVHHMNEIPSAGPYTLAYNDPQRTTQIRRNPYWRRGPGRHRPRHLRGVTIVWNNRTDQAYLQTLSNEFDEGPVPPEQVDSVANRFGVNRSRFWVMAAPCTGFIAFNTFGTFNGLLHDNVPMRKALNWAFDRTAYAEAAGSYIRYAGSPWTHVLPPRFPGSVMKPEQQPYSAAANLTKARELAAGHFRNGKIIVWWRSSGVTGPAQKQVVVRDLIRLGFKEKNIKTLGFPGSDICCINPRNFAWDLGLSMGWCQDYPDPYTFFEIFLHHDAYNLATEWPNKAYRKKIAAADKLVGNKRLKTFGKLDLEIINEQAPLAVMRTYNSLYLFSNRVDPRSLIYNGVYMDWSIPALRLR